MKKIAIINYKGGNGQSVYNALQKLNSSAIITADYEEAKAADALIIPGVGSAPKAMRSLQETKISALITSTKKPVLGICLGMQILGESSQEGDTQLLQLIPAAVIRFPKNSITPHMGWNQITGLRGELFQGISEGTHFYFVHSYFMDLNPFTTATCIYENSFSAALTFKNYYGTQFHPEKSGDAGMQLLENFINLI